MCITMYIMRTCADQGEGKNAEGEEREKDRDRGGARRGEMAEERRVRVNDKRKKDDDKRWGREERGTHADEGKGGGGDR